eukprot:349806-Chlamydomonas_euryale.AAC.1
MGPRLALPQPPRLYPLGMPLLVFPLGMPLLVFPLGTPLGMHKASLRLPLPLGPEVLLAAPGRLQKGLQGLRSPDGLLTSADGHKPASFAARCRLLYRPAMPVVPPAVPPCRLPYRPAVRCHLQYRPATPRPPTAPAALPTQVEAEAAGGKLYVLNGNHETMNVATNHRYATPGAAVELMRWKQWRAFASSLREMCATCAQGGGAAAGVPPPSTAPAPLGVQGASDAQPGLYGGMHFERTAAWKPGSQLSRRFLAPHPITLQVRAFAASCAKDADPHAVGGAVQVAGPRPVRGAVQVAGQPGCGGWEGMREGESGVELRMW